MASKSVGQFFEQVYNDKALQGALNAALVAVAPDAVVEIAKTKGFQFSKDELRSATGGKGELSDQELGGVAGGLGSLSLARVASFSLANKFWANTFGGFKDLASAFGLTIPGPSFVHVQTPEDHQGSVDREEAPAASAVALYDELS
jgi:predicted ribosomally synthesized peptide with nif11-like leader